MTTYTDMWDRVENRWKGEYGQYLDELKQSVQMREMVLLGRGGEGTWMMGELLCSALIKMGKYASVIFINTGERRGTITRSYIRYADAPVHFPVSNIYAPDVVVCGDSAVHNLVSIITDVDVPAILRKMGPDSIGIINSSGEPEELDIEFAGRLATVDVTSIALRVLGNEFFTNTAMLGAFIAATRVMDLAHLQRCIREFRNPRGKMPFVGKAGDLNTEAARIGYESLKWRRVASGQEAAR